MTQAVKARDWVDRVRHQMQRSDVIDAGIQHRAEARTGLIYTRAGVLDMTRQRVQRQPAVEEIVMRIGGAKAW